MNICLRFALVIDNSIGETMIATQQRQNFRANNPPPSSAQLLREAQYMVDRFLFYVRNADIAQDIIDTNDLPDTKTALINACRLLIAAEKRPQMRARLIKVGLMLASFQPAIGERISMRPVTGASTLSDDELQREMTRNRDALERMDAAFAACASERLHLFDLFRRAAEMAARSEAEDRGQEAQAQDRRASTH
jgi:hypothetical protein